METPLVTRLAAVGDVHGHLQLACAVVARWQQELGSAFEAVLLCGDVGTFTADDQLDSATRRHARTNPCELEFLRQWSTRPPAPWLDAIFQPIAEGGLGLTCPLLMVHGNHEGFAHLERLVPPVIPPHPVAADELPAVDTHEHLRMIPSGWRVRLPSGRVVAAVGGIEPGQRRANYRSMAYIAEEAVLTLLDAEPLDVLLTHQGPAATQGNGGAELLQPLLDEGLARVWLHGHSIHHPEIRHAGRAGRTLVVPLADIAFHVPREHARAPEPYLPGTNGYACVDLDEEVRVRREDPPFLRQFSRHHWLSRDDLLICPPLAGAAWRWAGRQGD